MKLFGEFLVEKNLISKAQLLENIIAQIESTPTLANVLLNEKLLDESKLLEALKLQYKTKKPLKESCAALNLWNKEIESAVEKTVDKSRIPLGQLLIKKNLVTLDQLTLALQEYMTYAQSQEEVEPSESYKFLKLDEITLKAFTNLWSEDLYKKLLTSLTASDLKIIKGLFRVVSAEISEKLCHLLEKDPTHKRSKETLTMLWEIRNSIVTSGSEEAWFKDSYKKLSTHCKEAE